MHKDFRTQLSHDIREYFHNNTLPELEPTTTWQAHKAVVRGIFISRAAYIKRTKEQKYLDSLKKTKGFTKRPLPNPYGRLGTEYTIDHETNKWATPRRNSTYATEPENTHLHSGQ
ncbi:Hypothetical predicted protein [Pelobates cultripes]|uniref:Uncharacterized protein n=1 Tax=Pelobates cultripes TaxID=61616 RepID=A0AAD1S7V1_PELCU|nr:Hypothetical predicted protein [Pelobates cultripes]